jgi:hypothetical protein
VVGAGDVVVVTVVGGLGAVVAVGDWSGTADVVVDGAVGVDLCFVKNTSGSNREKRNTPTATTMKQSRPPTQT